MKMWKAAIVAVIVLGGFAVSASAQCWNNPKVIEKLGLTDEQAEQLRAKALEHHKGQIAQNSRARIAQLELTELWKAESLDESQILAKVKEVAKLQEEQRVARAQHRLNCSKILTPEQRKKIRKVIGQRRGRGMAGRGRGLPAQGLGKPQGPAGPVWDAPGPPRPPAMAPFGPGHRQGRRQLRGPDQRPGRPGPGFRQWGALDSEEAPFARGWLAAEIEE